MKNCLNKFLNKRDMFHKKMNKKFRLEMIINNLQIQDLKKYNKKKSEDR